MDYSLPGSSVHGIFQARILKWLPFPPPRDLPDPGIELGLPALAGIFLTPEPSGNSKWYFGRQEMGGCAKKTKPS